MSIQTLTNYFLEYGAFFIFLIVLLEYLNLPGFPAGVIMPLSGIWASQGEISFPLVMVLTVAAGLTGAGRCIGWEEQAEIRCWAFISGNFRNKRKQWRVRSTCFGKREVWECL